MLSPLLILRQVNEKLRVALQHFRPDLRQCLTILPAEFSSLRAELLRARTCLHESQISTPDPQDAASFTQEVREYRANLEKLKHILPDLQMRLLAERARLRKAQVHVAATAAWAGASKKTLQK